MIVIPEIFLITLIGFSFFLGVGIGFFLKRKNRSSFQGKFRIYYKLKRYTWSIIGIFWLVLLISLFPIYGTNFIIDSGISLISLVIGFKLSYELMRFFMRKSVRSDFDIWLIRIKAIIFVGIGFFILIFGSMSTYIVDTSNILPMVGPSPLTIYFWAIGFGLIIFAGYMEFIFERRAGSLVFIGKQKF